jgi:tetratricopeptide (TPR) repeat protein
MIINRRYDIIKKIGEGRSQVFLVTDNYYPNISFAMKLISQSVAPKELQSFKDEYYLLKSFNHRNIVKAFFNGVVSEIKGDNLFNIKQDDLFFTMEYIEGKIFTEVSPVVRLNNYKEIAAQISSVLFYLHQSNLIYYDLKPENIIFCENKNDAIKFIDFGFTETFKNQEMSSVKGTPQLISPEMLGQKIVDFRTDIYSFGIFLYWMVFDKYPFDDDDELEIYKQHISGQIKFPDDCHIDKNLLNAISKATSKEPDERFSNSIEMYSSISNGEVLDSESFENVHRYFVIENTEREISRFIDSKDEFFMEIIGFENSGKTKLLEQIKRKVEPAVMLDFADEKDTRALWRSVISDLLFIKTISADVFKPLSNYFENYFDKPDEKLDELILTFFSRISNENEFTFLIDNYDKADESSKEILNKLLNMLKINRIKIFVTSKNEIETDDISVQSKIYLTPLNEKQISDYIDFLFYNEFPKEELKILIQKYSDKYFGSINQFIKRLLQLKIISYSENKPKIDIDNIDQSLLTQGTQKILDGKNELLDKNDILVLSLISSFEKTDEETITEITGFDSETVERILSKLEALNIIYERKNQLGIKFIADSYKNYYYSKVEDKKAFHRKIIEAIKSDPKIITREKIYHFQMAEEYDSAVNLIENEIQSLESFSAYSGIEKLIYKILSFPVAKKKIAEFQIRMLENYLKLGNFQKAIEFHQTIDSASLTKTQKEILDYLKGRILYRLGNNTEALSILQTLIENITEDDFRDKIKIELASIYLDICEFENARKICSELINQIQVDSDIRARAFNLLALVNIYGENNFKEAASLFAEAIKIYEKNNDKSRLAGVELNLGNVLHILGEVKQAFHHWEKAQQLNKKIGNFQQEANSLLSIGVYTFNNFEVDDAIEKYRRANTIYKTIGNKFGAGTSHCNLAECFIFSLDFSQAEIELKKAVEYLSELQNTEENIYVDFLEGVFYLKLDMNDKLNGSLLKLEGLSNVTNAKLYLDSLKLMQMFKEDEEAEKIKPELDKILSELFTQQNLFVIYIIFIEALKISEYSKKCEIIKKITELPLCNQLNENNYIFALKMAFSSVLATTETDKYEKSPIQYLLMAYEKLKSQTVSETTVLVIFDIVRIYIENGNVWKAKEFFYYLESLYEFIKDNISRTHISPTIDNISFMQRINNFILTHKERLK